MTQPLKFSRLLRPFSLIALIVMLASLLFTGGCASVNKEAEAKTIGVLLASDMRQPKLNGLKEGLSRYGYVEGKNVSYIVLNANQQSERLPGLARELVLKHPDVIVVTGEPEALAAQKATADSKIPVVFVGVGFAQDIGLVKSYTNTGNNITGVDNYYLELSGKRLEYFQRLLPDLRKVAVLYDPRGTPPKPTLEHLNTISKQLDIEIQAIPVGDREDVVEAVRALNREEVDGIMLLCSLLLESITDAISPVALEKGFPVMGVSENQTLQGLLASYGMPYDRQGVQAARIVAKVLRGQSPATIPVESPAKVEFIVNLETARKLNLNLDAQGLACATKFVNTGLAKKGSA